MDPVFSSSDRFIETLTALAAKKDPDHTSSNAEILKRYKLWEIEGLTPGTKTLLRKWVPQQLAEAAPDTIPAALELLNTVYHGILGGNKATLDGAFSTDIRRPIFTRFGRGSELHMMAKAVAKISYEDKGALIDRASAGVVSRNADRIEISAAAVAGIITKSKKSADPFTRAVGLLLASGARPVELFAASEFSKYTTETPSDLGNNAEWVMQEHLAKKRAEEAHVFKPLVSMTAAEFLEGVAWVRKMLADKYGSLLNYSGMLRPEINVKANRVMRGLFDNAPRVTLYTARGIYSSLSYLLHGRGTMHGANPSQVVWTSRVLGHSENDLTTAAHYTTICFTNDQPPETPAPVDMKARVRAAYLTRIKAMHKKDPHATQTQLEKQARMAVPRIPRALVREFYAELRLSVD